MQRRTTLIAGGLSLGLVLFAASAIGLVRPGDSGDGAAAVPIARAAADAGDALGRIPGASLDDMIAGLQDHLEATPNDHAAWATLGLAYVQQAKATVDPTYYAKADGALQQSLDLDDDDNFLVYAGLSALANARHDFAAAATYAEQGLAINAYSAILHGALSDAQIQLGRYDDAFDSVQRMVDLSPDTSSLSRASYTWELRGDLDRARDLMERALADAPTPSDRAFAHVYLGELDFNAGDPNAALAHYRAALDASPTDPAALAGKAKAEAALGQVETALDDYAALVARAPEPSYLLEYGELLESLGRTDAAEQQYAVFEVTQALFEDSGVEPDATPTLFEADHGDPAVALAAAEEGVRSRPFLVMYDAYAWALHRNGRDVEALAAIEQAMALGMPSALFSYHAGMIERSLGNLDAARAHLADALRINPHFNPLAAPIAAATLAELGGAA